MEPQDNTKLGLQKAINAHEQAEAAMADLVHAGGEGSYEEMLARLKLNLEALRAEAASGDA